jgi:transmembrane sensor
MDVRNLMTLDDGRRAQAAAWFAAQRRGLSCAEERRRLECWCADGQNQAALDRVHGLWDELEGLKNGARVSGLVRAPARRLAGPLALAACLLATVAGGVMWWQEQGAPSGYTARTAVGERRSVTLPDGSRVELNVVTRIDYRERYGRRDLKLLDGEALFFVHKDAAHPFIVRAGDYEVRAVGTAFNVRARDGMVQVALLEGVVSVRAVTGPQAGRTVAVLRPGQKIVLAESPPRAEVQRIAPQAVAEWREHTVSYEDVPIAQVVEDMNRLFARPLQVADAALAGRRVTLRLQVQDRAQTLQTLSALLGTSIRSGRDADAIVGPKP